MEVEFLQNLGLTKAETKIYLALNKLGSTTSGHIVDESKVSRSKVYQILNRLQEKGLITSIKKGDTNYYNSTDPEKIIEYIKYKKNELEIIEKQAKEIIPKLRSIRSFSGYKEEAEVYRGLEGIKAARNISLKVLRKGELLRVFGSDKVAQDAMPAYWGEYHKERIRKGIKAKYLMKENSRKYLDKIKRLPGQIEIKYVPVTNPVYIDIFADYVITTVMKPGYYVAFLIRNQFVADYYNEWFDQLWHEAKD